MRADLFYKYYDKLFPAKDYNKECDAVFSIAAGYGVKSPSQLLEIGCGTGSHTVVLAKRVKLVFALDTDAEMLLKAKEKISLEKATNVELFHGPISASPKQTFDLALALFNVITYINNEAALEELFTDVCKRLQPGGIFIFDCWNGLAAILDPPKGKKMEVKIGNDVLTCDLSSKTDFMNQKTRLTYSINLTSSGSQTESGEMSFDQTLWTPMQIRSCLRRSGLEELNCTRPFDLNVKATEKDWKIMFVCRRP